MIICLTWTIQPPKNIKNLKNTDPNSRLREYVDNIIFLIKDSSVEKIVFCESSNYQSSIFSFLQEFASFYWKYFEYLSFKWNSDKVISNGRWYWEQEILEFFIKNSVLLKNEKEFFKLTGRYKIKNINDIIVNEKSKSNVFVKISPFDSRCNTAFFKSSVSFFTDVFVGCAEDINDDMWINYQIEWIYQKRLKKSKKAYRCFKKMPIFEALTWSGYVLKENFIIDSVKQLLNILWLYKI